MMRRYIMILTLLALSLHAQEEDAGSLEKVESEKRANSEQEMYQRATVDYNLSATSDFYFEDALDDYSELTDCEEDAIDQMSEDAMAAADLCPTHNIEIRLAHPIEIKSIEVTGRKISNEICTLDARYTLSTLSPDETEKVEAVCKKEYEDYGASLMLDDGLWNAVQFGFGFGYSGGDVADMQLNSKGTVFAYRYEEAPLLTADAAYLHKLPLANLYALLGGELGWVLQQKNTHNPVQNSAGEWEDGGSPYIFRVGINGGLGYRFHMRYDLQAQVGYQFQYLYRTLSTGDTYNGYENNIVFALRGAYYFHEYFSGWVKVQNNTAASTATVGLTYEFWN